MQTDTEAMIDSLIEISYNLEFWAANHDRGAKERALRIAGRLDAYRDLIEAGYIGIHVQPLRNDINRAIRILGGEEN